MPTYDPKPTKDYCEANGLAFSLKDWQAFTLRSMEYNLKQEQLDFVMREHAWRLKVMFTPKQYKLRHRILVALHFLNPFAKGL